MSATGRISDMSGRTIVRDLDLITGNHEAREAGFLS